MKKAIVVITILCLVMTMGYSAQKKKTKKDSDVNIEFNFAGNSSSTEDELEDVEDEARNKTKKIKSVENDEDNITESDSENENITMKKKRDKENDVTIIDNDSKRNKRKSKFSDTTSMIKMGKSLTAGGITSLILGTTFLSIGIGTAFATINYSFSGIGNFINDMRTINWNHEWNNIFTSLGGSWEVTALFATTCLFWSVGGILMFLSLLMIPGIIIWARGVYLDKNKKVSMSVTGVENGLALSIKF